MQTASSSSSSFPFFRRETTFSLVGGIEEEEEGGGGGAARRRSIGENEKEFKGRQGPGETCRLLGGDWIGGGGRDVTKPTNSPDQLVGLDPRPCCCTQFRAFLSLTVGQSGHVCSLSSTHDRRPDDIAVRQ